MSNYKKIHIGEFVRQRVAECDISIFQIASLLQLSEREVENLFLSKNIDTDTLLQLSKFLKYDFFRIYTHHLILYSPPESNFFQKNEIQKTELPQFRKNIYNKEIIDFILELIENKEKTKQQIINEYRIPKTTLYKWIKKYSLTTN